MIDIPAGKALAAVENTTGKDKNCYDCALFHYGCREHIACCPKDGRKDGKDVKFKLVDCPAEVVT